MARALREDDLGVGPKEDALAARAVAERAHPAAGGGELVHVEPEGREPLREVRRRRAAGAPPARCRRTYRKPYVLLRKIDAFRSKGLWPLGPGPLGARKVQKNTKVVQKSQKDVKIKQEVVILKK